MMRSLLWKEYREHRLTWLTMAVVNSGALIGMARLDESGAFGIASGKLLSIGPVAVLLVWAYGMICGSMLLAGEREEGTLSFLDILPISRLRLWLVKAQIGLFLLGGQVVVLCGWLAVLQTTENPTLLNGTYLSQSVWPFALGMLFTGVVGIAYGLFFSARGENVLHTIGLTIAGTFIAIIVSVFLGFVLLIVLLVGIHWLDLRRFAGPMNQGDWQPLVIAVTFGGLTLAAIVGSARIFCNTDQQRLPVAVRRMRARASVVASWLRILWLCDRQMRRMALGVLAFSLGMGVLFLVAGPLLWPIMTLFLGVLCGVTVFSDEQANNSNRFLGDQRLPLGRVWFLKIATRFTLLLLASFLLLLPSLLVAVYHNTDHSPSERNLVLVIVETLHLSLIIGVVPLPAYLLLWLLYGFSAGQLCSLLSRKSIVAAMIALMVSASLAVVWIPSLAGIGLNLWQVAGPPLILLATAALLVRAWAADRLASWRTYLSVGAATAASLSWMVFGLWYRVVEVPDVPEPFDVAAYKASLPALEDNPAGQLVKGAWGRIETVMRDLHGSNPRDRRPSLIPELHKVMNDGWPKGKPELDEWMNKAFAEDWVGPLAPLPDLPLGMVVDPRLMTQRSMELQKWHWADSVNLILAGRGLQQQTRGDPAVFVEHLRIALALSRNVQHHFPSFLGRNLDRVWPAAVDQWLKDLRGRPDLLERALQTLVEHEAKRPDEEEASRADYVIAQNTLMQTPEQLLGTAIQRRPKGREEYPEVELNTAAALWLVPWEQARHQRLLRVEFGGNELELRKSIEWGGDAFSVIGFFTRRFGGARRQPPRALTNYRACQLKVALRLYQAENGDLPDSLDALVPRYLKSLPRDPFAESQPFHYRRSRGEWIVWPEPNQGAQPPGMGEARGEVPLMPHADGQAVPQPAAMIPEAMLPPGAGMPGMMDGGQPPDGFIFMPRAEEPDRPPPVRRQRRRGIAGMPADAAAPLRFVPKDQGILWSVGEDGQNDGGKEQGMQQPQSLGADLIYLVPPPP